METTKTLTSRSGADALGLTGDPSTGFIRIHHQHTDDFDGDQDSWVTIGEFRAQDIIDALLPPVTATHHISNAHLQPVRRRAWFRKRETA